MAEERLLFRSRICTWEDISYEDGLTLLQSTVSREVINRVLYERLGAILSSQTDKRKQIILDLFYYVVLFARKNNFDTSQLSTLMTIIKTIHLFCVSTPYDNIEDGFKLFEALLTHHCVHRPPYSSLVYSLHQAKLISEYVLQTYFKHYKMYKYSFTKRVLLDLHVEYEGVDDTPVVSAVVSQEVLENKKEESVEEEETADEEINEDEMKEEDNLTEDQKMLKDIISQSLNDHMKELKVIY
jgi:hypothetical protein